VDLMVAIQATAGHQRQAFAMTACGPMRQTLGTAVFSGSHRVRLIFTPAFYVVCRWLAMRFEERRAVPAAPEVPGAPAE
jgi:hypothetical protein